MGRGRLAVGVLALLAVACGSDDTGATLASTTTSPPSSANADDVTVEPGVEYARAEVADGRAPLLLDLYHPPGEADGPRPVAIVIHGGGFTSQSRLDDGIVQIAHALAEHGVVAASIDHRLDPQGPVPSDRVAGLLAALGGIDIAPAMAAAVDDTLTAIDWLTEHAEELRIDPSRLGLIGSSAGAITADTIACALDDLGDAPVPVAFVGSLWGGIVAQLPEATDGASQVDTGEAALFLVHGTADDAVPVTLSDQLAARAEARGAPVEYHRLPGGGHGYVPSGYLTTEVAPGQTVFDRMIEAAVEALA